MWLLAAECWVPHAGGLILRVGSRGGIHSLLQAEQEWENKVSTPALAGRAAVRATGKLLGQMTTFASKTGWKPRLLASLKLNSTERWDGWQDLSWAGLSTALTCRGRQR